MRAAPTRASASVVVHMCALKAPSSGHCVRWWAKFGRIETAMPSTTSRASPFECTRCHEPLDLVTTDVPAMLHERP